ncbi:MAG: homoserine O-acetyltransferase [Bacteroidota bacterium]
MDLQEDQPAIHKPVLKYYNHPHLFHLENGEGIENLKIAYTTFGNLNEDQSNVVWVCHALTANSDPSEWWPGLVGYKDAINPDKYFIVCANIIGSCYGSTCPSSENPKTGKSYGIDFPLVTIKDMANAHQLLFEHLGLKKIKLLIGGSMGGQQAMEWNISHPDQVEKLVLLATNARHSAWGIAFNAAQRMALEADSDFLQNNPSNDKAGLMAARAVAMLSYRSPQIYNERQTDSDSRIQDYGVEKYQRYQGQKLADRFDAYSYYALSKSMDTHNVARGRNSFESALSTIKSQTLVIGISSDGLFIPEEQKFTSDRIPDSKIEFVESIYGHDGFLVEAKKISELIIKHLKI